MRLARNPGTEFAGGDDHRGYSLTAPLTADGHLDEARLYGKTRDKCVVRRFAPDEDLQTAASPSAASVGSSTTTRTRPPTTNSRSGWASTASRWANTSPSLTRTAVR